MESSFLRSSKKDKSAEKAEKYNKSVAALPTDYELEIRESRERMFNLREENRMLKEQLDEQKKNERYISGVMLNAEKAAEKIIADADFEAAKKIYAVKEQEKQLQVLIAKYTKELLEIQKIASGLLHDIVERVSALSQSGIKVNDVTLMRETYSTSNVRRLMEEMEDEDEDNITSAM